MPIKPENAGRYPADWKKVREAILARAGCSCENCKAPNRQKIVRGQGADLDLYWHGGRAFCADTGADKGERAREAFEQAKELEVVLTIAHLDHVPENCSHENLRAWCQRCHLRYDAAHHAKSSKATREAKAALKKAEEANAAKAAEVIWPGKASAKSRAPAAKRRQEAARAD
jgi:5-methylcytosine-specific restriction endonuclease McrA